jgi:hypothetical protein
LLALQNVARQQFTKRCSGILTYFFRISKNLTILPLSMGAAAQLKVPMIMIVSLPKRGNRNSVVKRLSRISGPQMRSRQFFVGDRMSS